MFRIESMAVGLSMALYACGSARQPIPIPAADSVGPSEEASATSSAVAAQTAPTDSAVCGGFEARPTAGAAASLLSDRLSILPFEGLANSARPTSIMAATPTEDAETRLYVEDGSKQFVVYAEEMFAKPGADLAREVRSSDPYAKDGSVEDVTTGGLREIWITPRDLRADHEKALALRVYVVVPDGLLVRVSFFVSPEVIPDGSGCTALASRLAKTLAAGKRTVPTSARRVTLDAGRSMSLPQDFGFYAQPGPDFVVYHAYPITTLDGPEGSLHVYFGGHPEKPRGSANVTGSLLGKPTGFIDARDGEHHRREAVVQVPGSPGLFMHVFFGTSDAALFGELEKIAASIQ